MMSRAYFINVSLLNLLSLRQVEKLIRLLKEWYPYLLKIKEVLNLFLLVIAGIQDVLHNEICKRS